MKKGEQRFEDLLLRCLFPKGVPAGHTVNRTPAHEATLRSIHIIGQNIARENDLELRYDTDDEVDA